MPALASHRKARAHTGTRTKNPAVGFTTAAIAGVTLLSTQSAQAEPQPSVEEVQKKVDDLYRQAGTATQQYDRAKEETAQQRREVDQLLDNAAERTESLNEARRALGSYAAAQYRTGTVTPTAALLLADSPQEYFDQTRLMDRLSEEQREAVTDFEEQRSAAADQRAEATRSLETLTDSQASLRSTKETVQRKLAEARELLSKLTAEERARLAELERQREEEAHRKAEAKARAEAAARAEAEAQRRAQQEQEQQGTGTGAGTSAGSYAAKAQQVLSFARSQIGKPYVWGATGPSSYDCSGLTQAAWRAAGVDLPRTTWDQIEVGQRIAAKDLVPGDLVFFYDDISHVGIYIGNGQMIHAPKPGANVREESIYYMPIHGSVRPA
ncbi:NlpC/P60 family protein [Streptomyces sp. NPDC059828]|uniref:C40 family peptidase n=1 Tax=Streptomyces sp. NPDC059828 TaxID=3346965 RepID=UPI003660446D